MSTFENILYSVNTKLAFRLNETFYGKHFVWCSPVFDSNKLDDLNPLKSIPPSSNPYDIFKRIDDDVKRNDLHSSIIHQNKAGLKLGAINNWKNGIIDDDELARINKIIDSTSIDQFSPLLYLIPKLNVESKISLVPVDIMANPLSIEYQIVDLQRSEFDVMQF